MYTLSDHMDCVRCARFSPNSNLVATGSDDGTIKVRFSVSFNLVLFVCSIILDIEFIYHLGTIRKSVAFLIHRHKPLSKNKILEVEQWNY